MPRATAKPVSDAGSLKRGVVLLKLLATAGARGMALTELALKAGIPHPSAHRVLRQLLDEGLVARQSDTPRYKLGPLAFELGLASSTLYDIRDLCEPAMTELADKTEDTIYLVVRSGFDAVCMHRREGNYPIPALVLQVGSRRPLGVGAGGLAILAAIAQEERDIIIDRVGPSLGAFGQLTEDALKASCVQTRKTGLAVIQNRVNLNVTAVGRHFCDSMGQAMGALSVAAQAQRMTARRIEKIGDMLLKACASVESGVRSKRVRLPLNQA
jgi:DNA-binding IclR family transcriptional regulator